MIEDVVKSIETTLLVKESDFGRDAVSEVATFYETLERQRQSRIDTLVSKYKSIGPLLMKVEEIVSGTSTGASPQLSTYYLFWERRIFNAITQMILASMTTFQALLNVTTPDITIDARMRRKPLCKIRAAMNGKDIILTPALADVYKYISKAVKNIIESAKSFVRWMHGTCQETEPQLAKEDEEPIVFSFFTDVSASPNIIKMMLSLNEAIHKVFKVSTRYVDGWKRYEIKYELCALTRFIGNWANVVITEAFSA